MTPKHDRLLGSQKITSRLPQEIQIASMRRRAMLPTLYYKSRVPAALSAHLRPHVSIRGHYTTNLTPVQLNAPDRKVIATVFLRLPSSPCRQKLPSLPVQSAISHSRSTYKTVAPYQSYSQQTQRRHPQYIPLPGHHLRGVEQQSGIGVKLKHISHPPSY
jgi:hypothetical protein